MLYVRSGGAGEVTERIGSSASYVDLRCSATAPARSRPPLWGATDFRNPNRTSKQPATTSKQPLEHEGRLWYDTSALGEEMPNSELDRQRLENAPNPQNIGELTVLLRQFSNGEQRAAGELMRVIENELHRIAARYMRRERKDHTLQTTGLVNEAYMRLVGSESSEWNDRNHFFAVASRVMRQILIDYARSRNAEKRGGGQRVDLDTADMSLGPIQPDVLDVDSALTELAAIAPRQAQLVELRFFGGLSLEEAAEVLKMSARTADKDWALARAWLRRRLATMK